MRKKRIFSFILQVFFLIAVLGPISAWAGIAGDVDSSGVVDLKDAVLSLQVCAGMEPAGITLDADVNQDQKIGLEEAIYILGYVSDEGTLKYIGDLGEPDDYSDSLVSFEDSFPDTAGGFENFVAQLPEALDWRDYNAVTRSKDQGYDRIRSSLYSKKRENQGYCGSCWAFASVAAFESKILIAGGPEYNLSEQQQVTCNTENFGCCGGYISAATFWENRGPMPESCTDYEDFYTRNTSCGCSNSPPYTHCSKVSCSTVNTCEELPYRVNNYHSVNISSANEAKISLSHYGPGVFRYDVYDDFYTFWDNGSSGQVYVQSGSTKLGGHAVAIIGYDDRKGAWLCKNSWGENGPNGDGTFWIAYSGHRNDLRFRMSNFSITGVQACEYAIYPSGQSFSSSGGTGSIGVTATSGCTWTAIKNASWITITSGSSGTSNGTVYYSVASNTGTNSRTGIITAAGKVFTITQSGLSCSYTISPASHSFDAYGGAASVSITATSGCQWTASGNASWITIVSGSSKTGNGTVNYQVAANTSTSSRTGTITIAGKTFTITQSGTPCSYTISPASRSFTSSAGNSTVSVSTSSGCAWIASSNASWITITSGSNGNGNGTVSYSVAANTSTSSRTGTITIAGKTFTVTQASIVIVCTYSISPVSNSFDSNEGAGSVSVTSPTGCAWTSVSNVSWMTITSGSSGSGNGTISYSVAENTGTISRTGTITIAGKTFTVTQTGRVSVEVIYTGRIPDSGQARCYDAIGTEIPCAGTGQDGEYLINPRSYTKMDASGSMVRDNVTGLIWEVKQNKDGVQDYSNPHDADNTYTWYDSNSATNGGNAGTPGDGTDTEDFINALNNSNYGGHNDWRMPTIGELAMLIDLSLSSPGPTVDSNYFPSTPSSAYYWASDTYANDIGRAWVMNIAVGYDDVAFKTVSRYVRAVRSSQTASSRSFTDNSDNTVTDVHTGLMWQQNEPGAMVWNTALSYCESLNTSGYEDWRLPTREETRSIIDYTMLTPCADTTYFPSLSSHNYWVSTTYATTKNLAWYFQFSNGDDKRDEKTISEYVRAVRGGQPFISGHIYITSPLQASHWNIGNSMPVRWNTQGITGNVKISLSRDGGKTFSEIIASSTPNDGSYTWTVTSPASVNCALKVEPLSDSSRGTVQSLFEIK